MVMKILSIGLVVFGLLACQTSRAQDTDDFQLVGKFPAPEAVPDMRSGQLWYRISVEPDHLDVRVRMLSPAAQTRFFLPGRWAHQDHAENVRVRNALGPLGPRMMTIDRDKGVVDIDARDLDWVELHYVVSVSDSADELRPAFDAWGLLAYGPTFLVVPGQRVLNQMIDIPVEVHVPDDFSVVSTWKRSQIQSSHQPRRNVHGFIVEDAIALRDSYLAAGPHLRSHDENTAIRVTITPAHEPLREELTELTVAVISDYRSRFGHLGPVEVMVRPREEGEMRGLGRRGGFILEIPTHARIDDNLRILVAHEAFHLWNGHQLTADPETEPQTRWFKEGLTHWVALQTLFSLGKIDERALLEELAAMTSKFQRNPLRTATQASPIDEARFPYDHGVLVALSIDYWLMTATDATRNVDDWIRAIESRLASEGAADYTMNTLREAFVGLTPDKQTEARALFQRLIYQPSTIDPFALYASLGLHWLETQQDRGARLSVLDRPDPVFWRMMRRELSAVRKP